MSEKILTVKIPKDKMAYFEFEGFLHTYCPTNLIIDAVKKQMELDAPKYKSIKLGHKEAE